MKTYLFVPYEEKDEAKRLGARWDAEQKKWYVPDGLNVEPFSRWLDREVHTSADPTAEHRDPEIEPKISRFGISAGV
jgi:hypothetical protein